MYFFSFFVLFFFLELFLLVMAAVDYGWPIFWLEVATALIGMLLIHRSEITVRQTLDTSAGMGPFLLRHIQSGMRMVFAGFLLIIPGFITDLFGLFLLFGVGIPMMLKVFFGIVQPDPQDLPPKPRSSASGTIVEGEVEPSDKSLPPKA